MIESIEVLAQAVHTIVAQKDTIRVEHRHDQEIELISELDCLLIISKKPIYHAFHSMTGSNLARMNP